MNYFTKSLAVVLVVCGFSATSFGQVADNATASATIVTPIAIAKTVDMNFGNVAISTALGTVELAPTGTRTPSGGVTLPATAGTVAAAEFDITGEPNYTYSITLPSTDHTITHSGGVETMIVNGFTSSPTPTGTLDGAGAETVTVGATLNVAGSQLSGLYVSLTPFDVTVNYN